MRLLDAKRLELVDVRDDAIPPYAILSHTWGNEEITLQELRHMKRRMPQSLDKRKRTIADKNGFMKVKAAAALAVSRGFSYIWADTCCIDKSSSSELSEAINSMYLWYQQAAECYAYLSDVKSANEEEWSKPRSSLRHSRWFTRGWTLQELIAPKLVHFYAKDWTFLGHKDGPIAFTKIISEVTGIDVEVLDGRIDPLQLSISARMKWASHRHTTRLEDTAYSLIGLFQVNMPLLYGEGHRAFTRLQEEIIQRSDDQSIYAWNSIETADEDPDDLSGLLAHSPEQFKDIGNIHPLPPSPVYASAPSSMTNQGLRVQLYLRPLLEAEGVPMEEDYYAILDCFVGDGDLYQCPVILLRRLSQDQYARFQTKYRKYLPPPPGDFLEYEGYRTIYVRQQPVYYNLPQFRVSPTHIHPSTDSQQDQQYKLVEIFPHREWNSTTLTMKVKYSRKLQAMGVFRFQTSAVHDKKVDVVVGLRRLDAMQWEGWCFQRACQGSSLESTLSVTNQRVSQLTRARVISTEMLRESLGDDSKLVTDATVEGMQLQGRLYISISISQKPEIQSMTAQVRTPPKQQEPQGLLFPTRDSRITIPLLYDFQVRTLTGPCSRGYLVTKSLLLDDVESSAYPLTVRSSPETSGISPNADLSRSLHDFVKRMQNQEAAADPERPVPFEDQLAVALFTGDRTKMKQLLAVGFDLNTFTSDEYGFTPLHWAVAAMAGNFWEGVTLLGETDVNPFSVTRHGWTALHIAAVMDYESSWKPLLALERTNEDFAEFANKRTRDHLETALHLAAAYCEVSAGGMSFFEELSHDALNSATLFARNKHDETPLHRAAAFNNPRIIRSIVKQETRSTTEFIDVTDRYGRSPLWHAAATGSCDAIRVLLSFNASIDFIDDLGRSGLHAACRGGHHQAVELLLQEGAEQSTPTSLVSLTAMDYAAMFGHVECLRHLLTLRPMNALLHSRPETVASQNRSLHIAASCGWLKCVDLLCEAGANPFERFEQYLKLDDSKMYAIVIKQSGDASYAAAKEGNSEIVKYIETSDHCAEHRRDRNKGGQHWESTVTAQEPSNQSGNTMAIGQGLIYAGKESQQSAALQQPPYQTVQSQSFGNTSTGLRRYALSVPYRDFASPHTAPFVERPSRGSYSATLPARSTPEYSSPGYRQAIGERREPSNYRLTQPSPYPSLPYGRSPTPYDPRHSPYGSQIAGRPQSYASINRPSLPLGYLPDNRYTPPVPIIPWPYSTGSYPPRIPTSQRTQELSMLSPQIRANMLRMLGRLGVPGLLAPALPTDSELSHYDTFLNCFVYQERINVAENNVTFDADGFPLFELSMLKEPKPRATSSEAQMGRASARRREAMAFSEARRASDMVEQVGSSIRDAGSWMVWPIPAWT